MICKSALLGAASFLVFASPSSAQDQDIRALLQRLEQQEAEISSQQQQLDAQARELREMREILARINMSVAASSEPAAPASAPALAAAPPTIKDTAVTKGEAVSPAPPSTRSRIAELAQRDDVGDLNRAALIAGDFPGSFKIAGGEGVSLAIGGFVKTVAIADSSSDASGTIFLPALLGTQKLDKDGNVSIDSTLSRVFIDARAPMGDGLVRGYIETDLNGSGNGSPAFNLRLAYGTWTSKSGTLLVGHYWSTIMDLRTLPEGLTEPTVSGAFFTRQSQIRWTQPLSESFSLDVALEDPSNNDFTNAGEKIVSSFAKLPDAIIRFDFAPSKQFHLSLGGIVRDVRIKLAGTEERNELGWGTQLSGHVNIGERDRLSLSGLYGKGIGRYVLGIVPSSGAAVFGPPEFLTLRNSYGGFGTLQHRWSEKLRSNFTAGYAGVDPLPIDRDGSFSSSLYTSANLLWRLFPFMTVGAEYIYGKRSNFDNNSLDNHRVSIGFQVF